MIEGTGYIIAKYSNLRERQKWSGIRGKRGFLKADRHTNALHLNCQSCMVYPKMLIF